MDVFLLPHSFRQILREADAAESLESAALLHHMGALHYYLASYPKAGESPEQIFWI